jgi:hypothetical protein
MHSKGKSLLCAPSKVQPASPNQSDEVEESKETPSADEPPIYAQLLMQIVQIIILS